MIRYRITGIPVSVAAICDHPSLADLRRHGPWAASQEADGSVVLTQMVSGWSPAGWGPWRDGRVPGRRYAIDVSLPDLGLLRRARLARMDATEVDAVCGRRLRIVPAGAEGRVLGHDGVPRGLAGSYSRALVALLDRNARGEAVPPADWMAVIRLAIQAGYRLTDEAIDALDLISDLDVEDYLVAMTRGPKAPAGDGGSSSPAPASTTPA